MLSIAGTTESDLAGWIEQPALCHAVEDLMPVPVLLLSRQLDFGGSERQLTVTALGLDRSLFEPHVGCFHSEGVFGDQLRAAGVPVAEFPVRSFRNRTVLAGARAMRKYIKENGIRLVHTFDVPLNVFGVPVARAAGVRRVLSSQRAQRSLTGRGMRTLLRLTDRMVDGIVTNCEAVQQELIEQDGVRADKIHVCRNGIDTAKYTPDDRVRPGPLADASVVIGTVSVLRREKGMQTLLDAFASVSATDPRLRLVIAGSGPMRDDLKRHAEALGIASRCWFEAATPQVATWLRGIDIFVLPSLHEALSNSLMEAMACGCCPVASNVGGNPELVQDGHTGLRSNERPADLAPPLQFLLAGRLAFAVCFCSAAAISRYSIPAMENRLPEN